ncbi:hypothetical protein NPX13_g2076 [Xylaria arbuscula]|uniref:Uncharacterized protein n=1 Tax=Xylaria arbuscula TaxID=114810 RepID=A0A9W8NKH1_9PEZI|nr:hypothetical protein NPX13_g2076 [Xylaria arbuscula]
MFVNVRGILQLAASVPFNEWGNCCWLLSKVSTTFGPISQSGSLSTELVSSLFSGSNFLCGMSSGAQTCILTASTTSILGTFCELSSSYVTPVVVPTTIFHDEYGDKKIVEIILYAPLFQLNWQSSDRPQSSERTFSLPAENTGLQSSSGMSDNPVEPNTPERPSHDLSTPEKTGIAIGVSIGFLALLAIVWFILQHRRSRLGHIQQSADDTVPGRVSELFTPVDNVSGRISELYGQEKYELPVQNAELYQEEPPAETQYGQGVMNGLHEMPDGICKAQKPAVNEGADENGGEQRGHEIAQVRYHEM